MNAVPLRFSVVIATSGRPSMLGQTLAGLLACEPPPAQLIVVDGDPNGSAEPVVSGVGPRDEATEIRYLASDLGLSIQRNRGAEAASGDVVVFLDDDVDPDRSLFAALADAYRDPSVIGATGRVIEESPRRFGRPSSPVRRLLFPGGRQGSMTRFGYPRRIVDPNLPGDVEWMQGCFMSARLDAALRVRHDERISGKLEGEDEDFSYRLSRLGRIRYQPQAALRHKQIGFRSSRPDQREFDRNVVLARAYLFRKNFRPTPLARLGFAWLVAVLVAHRLLNREWAGARGVLEGAGTVLSTRGTAALLERVS